MSDCGGNLKLFDCDRILNLSELFIETWWNRPVSGEDQVSVAQSSLPRLQSLAQQMCGAFLWSLYILSHFVRNLLLQMRRPTTSLTCVRGQPNLSHVKETAGDSNFLDPSRYGSARRETSILSIDLIYLLSHTQFIIQWWHAMPLTRERAVWVTEFHNRICNSLSNSNEQSTINPVFIVAPKVVLQNSQVRFWRDWSHAFLRREVYYKQQGGRGSAGDD